MNDQPTPLPTETQFSEQPGPRLEAINLTKRYVDGVLALDHINFAVQAGQIYAMLGANGAGKTTAINLFLILLNPPKASRKSMVLLRIRRRCRPKRRWRMFRKM
jgi:ABC-type multidrug transport system ATPase subunit